MKAHTQTTAARPITPGLPQHQNSKRSSTATANHHIIRTLRQSSLLSTFLLTGFLSLHAATILVTNTGDSGPGSLRQAIATAATRDAISFAVSGSITLTNGELLITKDLRIAGPGSANLAISAK